MPVCKEPRPAEPHIRVKVDLPQRLNTQPEQSSGFPRAQPQNCRFSRVFVTGRLSRDMGAITTRHSLFNPVWPEPRR